MDQNQSFLRALRAALRGRTVSWTGAGPGKGPDSPETWGRLLRMASVHNVLPMVYEAVWPCPAFSAVPEPVRAQCKGEVIHMVARQVSSTARFLQLYRALCAGGVEPVVVKGLICRSLYPQPDHRPSSDEDLLVPPDRFAACHALLLQNGLRVMNPQTDPDTAFEVSYLDPRTGFYLEVHKSLFEPGSGAVGDFNACFEDCFSRAVWQTVEGVSVRTLAPQDHLLYLILHAFKHFIHSGFGIRQICDIILMAEANGPAIDWAELLRRCESLHAAVFAASVFKIGTEHLGFDRTAAGYPAAWQTIPVDAGPMLRDILSGGVYGAADSDRQHSSTITLNAVEAARTGGKSSVLQSVFPARSQLVGRYPVLKKWPVLLPAVWADRLFHYGKELARGGGQGAAQSVSIGRQRVDLMRYYKIIR